MGFSRAVAFVTLAAAETPLAKQPGRLLASLCRRCFTAQADAGPKDDDLSAIPFQVTRQEAADAFRQYHRGHLLFTQPSSGLQKIKEAYLPFWVTTAVAEVELRGAQLGTDGWVQRYNPQTRRYEPRLETVWQWVQLQRAGWEQQYTPSEPGMQVYAAYKYPRSEVNRVRAGPAVAAARKLTPEMLVSPFDGSTRRVGAYEMKPSVALRFVQEHIRAQEEARARQFVKASFRCDRVGQLDLRLQLRGVAASPVYLPVFVFRSSHFGTKLRTFVSGVNAAQVTGTRALDEFRVGLLGGLAGALLGAASGAFAGMSAWGVWVWGFALPASLAGFAARQWGAARARWNAYWQASERASQAQENLYGEWDPEWVRQYARLFTQRLRGSARPGGPRDPKGYYSELGVEPGASKDEIAAAYRGLALKHHPDRVPEAEKAAATAKFTAIQEAYTVLRSAHKRAAYDAG